MTNGRLRYIKKRLIIALLIAALLPLQITGVSAVKEETAEPVANDSGIYQPIDLSLKAAFDKAEENTYSIKKIDKTIEKLWKQEDKAMSSSNSIQEMLGYLEDYKKLYEKKKKGIPLEMSGVPVDNIVPNNEEERYKKYTKMFGDVPPDFNSDEMYEQFIKTRDLTHYDVWAQIQNQKRAREVAKLKLEDGVRSLYCTVLYLKDMQNSSSQSLATKEKEYKDLLEKFKKGLVSEVDRYQCEIKLNQKRLEIKKQQRTLENTEMQLKSTCGISASQEIKLEAIGSVSDIKLLSYSEYCNKALENRNEILTDKLELQVVTRKMDITKQYKTNSLSIDRLDLQQQLDNATFSLSQSTAEVLEDIQGAYADIISKQSQLSTAKKVLDTARLKLTIAQKQYELGQVNILEVWSAKDTVSASEIGYEKAQQDFDYANYKINLATGVGPGYK